MNERVVVELTVDARGAVAGTAEFDKAMTKAGAAVDKVKAKSQDLRLADNLPRSVDRVTQAFDKLRSSIDPVTRAQVRSEQEMRKALALVDRAVMTGVATQQQAAATISALRNKQVADIDRVRAAQLRLNATPVVPTASATGGSASGGGVGAGGTLMAARGLLGPVAGVLSAQGIGEMADEWTAAGNKLRSVESITGMHLMTLQELNDVATETRTGFSETVSLYTRLATSSSKLVSSEQELADITETIAKSFKVGGAAASEQAAGILQLSQALGSGFLQGDELRSLRENAPLIAQAIAEEFNTTIGGLKQLGADGELTAERVLKAIVGMKDGVDEAFAQTNATIGESFTLLFNQMGETSNSIDKATGFTKQFAIELGNLSSAIDNMANNPGLDNFLAIFGAKLVEGGLADNIRDFATGAARSLDEVKADIKTTLTAIADLEAAGIRGMALNVEFEELDRLRLELSEIEQARIGENTLDPLKDSADEARGKVDQVGISLANLRDRTVRVTVLTTTGGTSEIGVNRLGGVTQSPLSNPLGSGSNIDPLGNYPTFATGGFTGHSPTSRVAGLVHGGEYVMDATTTRAIGIANLDAIRQGVRGYDTGGTVGTVATLTGGSNVLSMIEDNTYQGLMEIRRAVGYLDTLVTDEQATLAAIRDLQGTVSSLGSSLSSIGSMSSGGFPTSSSSSSGGYGSYSGGPPGENPFRYVGGVFYPGNGGFDWRNYNAWQGGFQQQRTGLDGFAAGGIAYEPSIFGEDGPEAAVPLPDGRTIPVTIKGSGKTINVHAHYHAAAGNPNPNPQSLMAMKDAIRQTVRSELGGL
jgi:tape measure domain-containing protein